MTTSELALPPWFGVAAVASVCLAAFWKGEWEERVIALGLAGGYALTLAVKDYTYSGPQWGSFLITVVNLALFTGVSLRSRKYWPLWATGFQLLSVVTHAAMIADSSIGSWAYITAGVIWTYLLIGSIWFGALGCARARVTGTRQGDEIDMAARR